MTRPARGAAAVLAAGALAVCASRAAGTHPEQVGTLVAAVALTAVLPLVLGLWRIYREMRLEAWLRGASIPGDVAGVRVRILDGEAPFVAGIVRAEIYWPAHLDHALPPRERRAVVLHEEHHRRHGAPRRLLLLALIGSIAPAGRLRRHLDRVRAELEIEADAGAIAAGASRGSLASALLRLAPASAAHGAGFTAAAELRVRTLLGEPIAGRRTSSVWAWSVAAAGLVAVTCLVFVA